MNKGVVVKSNEGSVQLKLVDMDNSMPSSTEIKVRWHASSLNYHDYLVGNGSIPVSEGRVLMSDGAGEIIEVGSNVESWKVGDKVMSLFFPNWIEGRPTVENTSLISGESSDGFALYESCVDEQSVTSIPEGYNYSQAATLPCAAVTAWRALVVEGNIKAGDKVLIEGTGGMCIFALQIAVAMGAEVYATTGSPEKIPQLKEMGAKHVVNYKEDTKWGKTIYNLSDGGVDHVIDSGGNATMRGSIDAVRVYGNIYSIGILGGPKGEIHFPKLFFKQIHLIGLAVGSAAMQNELVTHINKYKWLPVLDKSFDLADIQKAFDYQKSGKHFGKIVLEW